MLCGHFPFQGASQTDLYGTVGTDWQRHSIGRPLRRRPHGKQTHKTENKQTENKQTNGKLQTSKQTSNRTNKRTETKNERATDERTGNKRTESKRNGNPSGHRASGNARREAQLSVAFFSSAARRPAALAAWQRAPRRPGGAEQGYWGVLTHRATAP